MSVYCARDLLLVPNVLSAARVPLAVAFPFVVHEPPLALAVLGVAAVTDVVDGWLARRWHQDTPMGALVDGLADKLFAASLLGTLIAARMISPVYALLLATRELGELPLVLRMLMNRRARKVELDRKANIFGKVATVLEFATVIAVLVHAPRVELWVGVTSAFGAAAAVTYWAREIRAGGARRAPAAYAR